MMQFSESLKKNRDFQSVYRKGTSKADPFFVMYVLRNRLNRNRIGISASKKVGNSVVRHHLTRRVREAYRTQEGFFEAGYDMVFVVRTGARDCSQKDVEKSVLRLAKRQGVLKARTEA